MNTLYFHRIDSGYYASANGEFVIRRSPTTRMWKVSHLGVYLGFRPTLVEAKRMAERVAEEGRTAA